MTYRSSHATHRGSVRPHNEDALADRPAAGLFAVADGLGGHEAGELASGMLCAALEALPADGSLEWAEQAVRAWVTRVHGDLLAEARRRGPGVIIGATLVVLLLRGDSFVGLWSGDARLYRLGEGGLQRLTRDHRLVQDWVDAGKLTSAEADRHSHANIVTRAIGLPDVPPVLDRVAGVVRPGEMFLLCSDGVPEALGEPAIERLLREPAGPQADRLIAAALKAHASDNVTAVVVSA